MARTGFRPGDRERLRKRVRALSPALRKGVETALEENAEELAEAIRRRVPIDQGELRDSVRWRKGAARNGRKDGGADSDLAVRVIEGDGDAFYPWMVENGTVDTPAQPHFFPTYRAMKRKLKARLARAVGKAIREG